MAAEVQFIQDLAIVTGIAALTSLVFQRLRFPLVFGLLAAGVIIGPHTPPFSLVRDESTLRTLADLGVVLLLFGLGLDFNLRGLRRVGGVAAVVTLVEVLFMFWAGYEVARLLGWDRLDGIFLGAMLSISSTAIIVSVLREMGRLNEESSRVIFAVLVLEDIAAILMLVLIGGYAATGEVPVAQALLALGKMVLFFLALLVVGLLVIPRLIERVVRQGRGELLVLTVLGLGLLGALLSSLAGFHVGLGAFLMGALLAESKHRTVVEERLRPVHDYFAALFFVSIGTLVDFQVLATYWKVVAILVALVVVGKFVGGTLSTFLVGYPSRTAAAVGMALSQIGEFSFVIAALGLSTGAMSDFLFPVIVGVAAVTSFLSPLMIRHGQFLGDRLSRLAPVSLRTYASVYTSWMRAVRQRPGQPASTELASARRGAIVAALLVVLLLGSGILLQSSAVDLLEGRRMSLAGATLVYWGVIAALLAPTVFEFHRRVRDWTEEAQRARVGEGRGLGVRAVVQYSIVFVSLIVVGLPLLAATAPFFNHPGVVLTWIGFVGGAGVFLWTRIRRLHNRIQANVESLLKEEQATVPVPDVLQALFSRDFPLELSAVPIQIGDGDWAAGRRLGELAIRSTTGASVVLVERSDGSQEVPSASTFLWPGDRLTLVGAPRQVEAARAILLKHRLREEGERHVQSGKLIVGEASKWNGRRLSETSLPERHGLQVVAIQRGTSAIPNPGPHERLEAGDVLIVLGRQTAILGANQEALGGEAAEASPPAE